MAMKTILDIRKAVGANRRIEWAVEMLKLRLRLKECENDDERASILIKAAKGRYPEPVKVWAIRVLSTYPTEAAVKFLFKVLEDAGKDNRTPPYTGLEAQEALKRLKKIPEGVRRHSFI